MSVQDTQSSAASQETPVIELDGVSKDFALDDSLLDRVFGTQTFISAVSDVSFSIHEGETVAVVGESGCGKSTLANLITGIHVPTEGVVRIDGSPVGGVASRSTAMLSQVGVIFQNAKSSIDPRMTVKKTIEEPLKVAGWSNERRQERIEDLLELVNLSEQYADRYAHELSGGQAQRVAIARAIATEPRVLILDEPVSALDVSVKGSIINLLMELQDELGLTYLLVSHDLSVVKHIADRIVVMYLGEIMERAPATQVFESPAHPYTKALIDSIPDGDPTTSIKDAFVLEEDVPSPVDPPDGCVFHTRCPIVEARCREEVPDEQTVGEGISKCHFAEEVYNDQR